MKRAAPFAVLVATLASCTLRPPYLLVTVEDPDNLAAGFARLVVGIAPERLQTANVDSRTLPLTVTVTFAKAGEQDVWVEARDDSDTAMARGRTTARFVATGTPTAAVVLRNVCIDDTQCTGIGYCTGTKKCLSTICGCVESQCGDGFHDPMTEECDDGNTDSTDACTGECELARCGDGFVWAGIEACDDGNTASGDGCRGDCRKTEICGDGILDAGEECDDGNTNPNDGCYVADRKMDLNGCKMAVWQSSTIVGLGPSGGDPTRLLLSLPHSVAVDRAGNIFIGDANNYRVRRVDHATGHVTTVAGGGTMWGVAGDGGPATSAALQPQDIFLDSRGNVYIAASSVRRVDRMTGIITTVAGGGSGGDGGPATEADLRAGSVYVDRDENIFIADQDHYSIRRVDGGTGLISTVAGVGTSGFSGDDGPAILAQLRYPERVELDAAGNIYIADRWSHRVRRVDHQTGIIATVAGGGAVDQDNVPATSVFLREPFGLAFDAQGNLFVAQWLSNRVRRIDSLTGIISTVAGSGAYGFSGDGGSAVLASFASPSGIALDTGGNLFIADSDNQRIRRVDVAGSTVSTVAGGGIAGIGDGSSSFWARLNTPWAVVCDANGTMFVLECWGDRVRRIDGVTGIITTFAGNGNPGSSGDGGLATAAELGIPYAIALDHDGNLLVADTGNHKVRRVDALTGIITSIVGVGTAGFSGDDGLGADAQLNQPGGVVVDSAGNLMVADTHNHRVRRVDAQTGVISTIAGIGSASFSGDGLLATAAELNYPFNLTIDGADNLFIMDYYNSRVRRVDATSGIITTVAGDGVADFGGDGGPATAAHINGPDAIAADAQGNLFIADSDNSRIRRVDNLTGIITTVAGNGGWDFSGDFGPAVMASLAYPTGVFVDAADNLYITEWSGEHVRFVRAATGVITTIAGGLSPEGDGPLRTSVLGSPRSFASLNGGTSTLIADGWSGRVRRLDWQGQLLTTAVGYPGFRLDWQAPSSSANVSRLLVNPFGIVYVPSQKLALVSEREGHTLRLMTLTDPEDPATWTIEPYAGRLPRSQCCNLDYDSACTAAEQADITCADDSPGLVDGPLAGARFDGPSGMVYDALANVVYLADSGNHVVRRLDLGTSTLSTIAGTPRYRGFYGEDVDAAEVLFDAPQALAIGPNATRANGSLYIADTGNHRVRRLDLDTNSVSTVIGDGVPASSGVGSPARYFPVDSPQGLAVDRYGNLFITSRNAVRAVYAGDDGVVTGDDAVDTIYGRAPRETWPEPVTLCLSGIGVAPDSPDDAVLLLLDACQGFLVKLARTLD
jgi:cysteine-rich repeat protein